MIQLILTLKITIAKVVETSVTVNNSPIQDYVHLQDHAQRTWVNNYRYYAWLKLWTYPGTGASKLVLLCRLLRLMFFAQEKVFSQLFHCGPAYETIRWRLFSCGRRRLCEFANYSGLVWTRPGAVKFWVELTQGPFCSTRVNRMWPFCILGSGFAQIFGHIITIGVKTLSNANLVASRYVTLFTNLAVTAFSLFIRQER